MAVCPDFYDSDEDHFSDDCDYYDFKKRIKSMNSQPTILTEAEKLEQQKKSTYSAVCSGNKELVIQYLDNGLEINVNLEDNWTPLLLSVSFGNAEITSELLKRGADVNNRRDGLTALMMSCNCPKETSPFRESLKVIEMLVEYGANVNAINRKRMTALMFAANVGNLPAVKYLLPLSNKNAEDNQRWTALFWAVNGNSIGVVEYLLQEGLEYTVPDVRNITPLALAKNNDFMKIVELFPQEETDILSTVTNTTLHSYEEIFLQNEGKTPDFFLDICNFLRSVKSESTIKVFVDSKTTLSDFLTMSEYDLKTIGIKLPYQRYRILAGIHRFHKHPFHPKSLHIVPLAQVYTNLDVATELLTVIKQLLAMDAGLTYIMKNVIPEDFSTSEMASVRRNMDNIRIRLKQCKAVAEKLTVRTKQWDKEVKPVDLITSKSKNYRLPWRKILVSLSVLSLLLVLNIKN
ncbi:unnamed protein product [Phaedon cochleariae]|uniref:SAM domain-containing protein n=1 Tax=Phaedon cochleariae TaxID=80249 RepID=A0A9N9X610_PHACE|nr:unnamed protein product [Phaedon cochleariae]